MKTIKELSVELSLDRSTLLKAAQRSAFTSHKSGDTWLVDEESSTFKSWLKGAGKGRPRKDQLVARDQEQKGKQ